MFAIVGGDDSHTGMPVMPERRPFDLSRMPCDVQVIDGSNQKVFDDVAPAIQFVELEISLRPVVPCRHRKRELPDVVIGPDGKFAVTVRRGRPMLSDGRIGRGVLRAHRCGSSKQ